MPKRTCGRTHEQRFWDSVTKRDGDGCWIFNGCSVNRHGHKIFLLSCSGRILAHRYSWTLAFGEIGDFCVLHHCDNPPCVRPDHLFLGTRADNNADMDAKGRRVTPAGEKHPLARLTEDQVREIRKIRQEQAWTYARLGKKFGVATSTIQNVIECNTWKLVK